MQRIILYTIGCPRCDVLKAKLKAKNIQFEEETDEEKMRALGIDTLPVLEVDGILMPFAWANEWVKQYQGKEDEK